MAIPNNNAVVLPLTVSLIVSEKNGKPIIEVRRSTSDMQAIKTLISCAFHKKAVTVLPTFTNELKSLSSLVEKGLIYWNEEKKQYYFTF